ncbi:Outer membrane protein beta-barrel domain-containing protein [Algoriphagus faecimaris]|uniref:Outer membrane protein beta-barrel domain-containing protein n=2 Tax=Algoriphagus faecimaris TaxID=686796 RepID=A0A1G6SBP4_9BACT|nr:Outer membrane protein beta-barrel domain-containing protein [Algoriphagus faecimaris]
MYSSRTASFNGNLKHNTHMRKILILFFVIGFYFSAEAQFGVRAGLSSSNFSNTNFNANVGIHVGGYYTILASEFFSVEPGIQFSQKGFETIDPPTSNEVDERLNYVEVPVLVRLNFIPAVNVFAGPQFGALVSRKRTEEGNNQTSTEPVKGYDISGVVGLQALLPRGFNLQVSYDLGLTSVNYFGQDAKNQALKLSIAYDF